MDQISNDILTLAALVASYVGVFKALKVVDDRFSPIVALVIAAVFVLLPAQAETAMIRISIIGLSAAGVYHYSKSLGNANIPPVEKPPVVEPPKPPVVEPPKPPVVEKPIPERIDPNAPY